MNNQNNTSYESNLNSLDELILKIESLRGSKIQDRTVFINYLLHGGITVDDDGEYVYVLPCDASLDGKEHSLVFRPSADEVSGFGNLQRFAFTGECLYRIGDLQFVRNMSGEICSRHQSNTPEFAIAL